MALGSSHPNPEDATGHVQAATDATLLSGDERQTLRDVARRAIVHFHEHRQSLAINPSDYSPKLQLIRATFVTIHVHDALHGCIGTLEAKHPLVVDVAQHAQAAAFEDPRFEPMTRQDIAAMSLHISILSPASEMHFADEADLLRQLRPGRDGVILRVADPQFGNRRATFLPQVWEALPRPDARLFMAHLKAKAGLPEEYWSPHVRVHRYTTESV